MSQARLPGTVAPPAEARRMFKLCQAEWEKAEMDLAMAESDCTEWRSELKELISLEIEKGRAYVESEEVDVERDYWQAVEQVRVTGTMLKAARKTRSECRRIRDRKAAEYETAKAELEAIRRGQK